MGYIRTYARRMDVASVVTLETYIWVALESTYPFTSTTTSFLYIRYNARLRHLYIHFVFFDTFVTTLVYDFIHTFDFDSIHSLLRSFTTYMYTNIYDILRF